MNVKFYLLLVWFSEHTPQYTKESGRCLLSVTNENALRAYPDCWSGQTSWDKHRTRTPTPRGYACASPCYVCVRTFCGTPDTRAASLREPSACGPRGPASEGSARRTRRRCSPSPRSGGERVSPDCT